MFVFTGCAQWRVLNVLDFCDTGSLIYFLLQEVALDDILIWICGTT